MEIHLIRHTKPKDIEGLCYGFTDVQLQDNYKKSINELNISIDYDRVYSSPLSRCLLIGEVKGLKPLVDDRLKEMNFGDWENKKWNDIPLSEINSWYNNFVNQKTKNGESFVDLKARVFDFINDLRTTNYQKVLIITHAGVIRIFLHYILAFPLGKAFTIQVDYGSITKIKLDKDISSVIAINQLY